MFPSLRTTRTVIYTPQPSAAERTAMREIEQLQALETRTDDEARRLQELHAAAGTADQVRVTLGTMTVLQHGRFEANKRAAFDWMQATYGSLNDTDIGLAVLRWAYVMAAIVGVETRTVHRYSEVGEGAWKPVEIPPTWQTPDGYLSELPADLARALGDAALLINPGMFGAGADAGDDAKKNGGISVE